MQQDRRKPGLLTIEMVPAGTLVEGTRDIWSRRVPDIGQFLVPSYRRSPRR